MAQAVLELNAEDGGSRRFIAVQVPEECPPGSAAARAGFATITEHLQGADPPRLERQRRGAGRHPRWDGDTGFRVLRVDSTNMTDVCRLPDRVAQEDLAS